MAMPETGDAKRLSPDALLAEAARESRGRLKIFLGAAPGVGKTYAMLETAHERQREGIDVVGGVVETHGRQETETLVKGLEVIPRRPVDYRGRHFLELDLDGVLARRPAIALIDELAHTNIPGSRHVKRYQDVEELLAAGIDVYSTLNVQHLESLNDVIERIAGIRVRETVPDGVLQQADEIELIDLPPGDLLKRLAEGKVYVPEQARRATDHFFSPGNLTALRELALRQAAERVDAQMESYLRAHAIRGPWPTRERVMACIGKGVEASRVVRSAKRVAERRQAPWVAVFVETRRHHGMSEKAKVQVAQALSLAEELGGEAVIWQGDDVAQDLLAYAAGHNVTQIVVGRPGHGRLHHLFGSRSITDRLLAPDVPFDVLMVGGEADEGDRRQGVEAQPVWVPPKRSDWVGFGVAALAVAAVTGLGFLIHGWHLPLANISVAFLIAVLLVAMHVGLGPAIFASITSFLTFNFFFTEPRFTFAVSDVRNILTIAFYLLAAVITSNLASRLRSQVEATRVSARRTANLYEFSRTIAGAATQDDVLWAVVHHVSATIHGRSLVLLPRDGRLEVRAGYPPEDVLDEKSAAAADWAWSHGTRAGRGSATLPTSDWLFLPLKTARGPVGVLGVQMEQGDAVLIPDQQRLLDVLSDQAAVAIERTALVAAIEAARVGTERERLRTALLSSLSHDLRTPLVSIIGAAGSLLKYHERLDDDSRRELAQTIQDEAERLNRFVQNLLDMTKLGAGALKPRVDWVDLRDVVGQAYERARRLLGRRVVGIDIDHAFPLLCIDAMLMEQVFFNLLDNAGKYTPEAGTIKVWARPRSEHVVIEVCDEGPGIPSEDREHVFDMFYRVNAADSQSAGTGLGLAICRGIIEAHGGAIQAAGGLHGHGTCIIITLPLPPEPDLGAAAADGPRE
ncbi:MAG: sensor histidine kinase KdpD [Alphaproteobacteria bacterium]